MGSFQENGSWRQADSMLLQPGFRCQRSRHCPCNRQLATPPEGGEVALKEVHPRLWHGRLHLLQRPAGRASKTL